MYRVDKRTHRHRRARQTLVVLALALLSAIAIYALFHLRVTPRQQLRNSPSLSTQYGASEAKKVVIDKPLFRMELPGDWKEMSPGHEIVPAPTYSFTSPSTDKKDMYIYIDTVPSDMALNRAVTVNAQGDGIAYDVVSENCATFTDPATKDKRTGYAPGRWQAANFICDMGNSQRTVVGTVSTEGVNQVTVNGATTGRHKLFIMYTDNNINPSYSTLYSILGSLHFK